MHPPDLPFATPTTPASLPARLGKSLRKEVLLALAVGLASWTLLQFGVSRLLLEQSYAEHETADGQANLQRALASLDQMHQALLRTSRDWAHWDDT
jgi:sensor domain CHASE-containing protein